MVRARAEYSPPVCPLLHANLFPMLPHAPGILKSGIIDDFSQSTAACELESGVVEAPIDHHCQICPTCSHRLTSHRCKLVCTCCGYYLSCADYY